MDILVGLGDCDTPNSLPSLSKSCYNFVLFGRICNLLLPFGKFCNIFVQFNKFCNSLYPVVAWQGARLCGHLAKHCEGVLVKEKER